ncbi:MULTISPECIES: hypothetical protein [unclassified Janthinobacterium]|uniref:hypothetical protein n=1 Tax=unclassified Janthinobacterium TaxID=2610881 RepID=UPI00088D4FC2|nr:MULTISPECIES: hypothetical protein [unclassified Janthinobacterium]SDA70523.1 hypothetical protein SAMN03159349_03493 [Janthinobacterium sp. 551a]SFB56398.1 hypothetical protein SAMN03159300_107359 [Janthinobacterium sp. 344]
MRTWIACAGWWCVVSLGQAQEHAPPPAVPAPQHSASAPAAATAAPSAVAASPQVAATDATPPPAAATSVPAPAPAAEPLPPQTVTITANADAKPPRVRFTAYRESYLTAKKVWQVSSGSVVMALRLIPAKLSATIDDVRVALQGNGAPIPIKVSEGGVFVVPLNDDIAAQDGTFLVNKGKGELTANIVIQPAVARDAWNVTRVGQVLRDARRAVRAITPWYKRPFANEVQSLAFCAAETGSALRLMDGEQLIATLPMSEPAVNDINQPVFCKIFDGEDKYPGHYRVVLPEQATVLLL